MATAGASYHNLLEPPALVGHFLAHPPLDFRALTLPSGTPAFVARFDLLTTADDDLRRRVSALPLYRWWSRLLRPRTCFVGTTVSEYALLPRGADADALVREWRTAPAARQPFLIVKDLPQESPLLDQASNAAARAVARACEQAGFVLLEGQALAWVPIDFESTEDYLTRLSSSRRKDIRRKLRARAELEISEIPTGDAYFADAAVREEFYARYLDVYAQSEIHFDQLSREFFDALLQDASCGGIVFVYRHRGELIGWNLCFVVGDALVDKYVGFRYPQAREQNLYFVSWMHNLDYALRRDLCCYVAGWTDPAIKSYLGARFTFTRHAVRPRSRVLRAVLQRIAGRFESDRARLDGGDAEAKTDAGAARP
ncbi:peptidogalycan biosysnthesis protein [Dokdonella sp.]|uniref:peptidogalycan biosysnthesis protein n=1 Tax=Dokdonella sp. TaxID=2291710 RepID=UPI001B275439|nr:peptidogalycan biosysnthesis protein [Dokdonella sp.]MBO9664980.1 N-acetyltransferase [Dokdonella sp.]